MHEKLYTIPVTDAFNEDCECPVCAMKKELENNAIDFTMGPSYMEDDIRASTDATGFCEKHVKMLYENKNKLGLALMLKTHMDKTIKDLEKLSSQTGGLSSSLFKKRKEQPDGVSAYVNKLNNSCFICERISDTFKRYIITIFHLYKTENDFRNIFSSSKGLCTPHYGLLYEMAPSYLHSELLNKFITDLNTIYLENMKRVRDDVSWFIDKFDYRFENEPWKNSKDALPRAMIKTNSSY